MNTYRTRFLLALIGNIVLVVVLVGAWLHYRAANPMVDGQTKQVNSSAQGSMPTSMATSPESAEVPLVAVQISPQRLQSIGVKTGRVESKLVEDEIRVTGNVAVDETRLSTVQVRYSGYIQKVFADATYQYLRKGQPLFTIYSPELVATEREYLVAKQNQQRVAGSTVPGVAEGAASLLEAARERLKQWGVSQNEISRLESTGDVEQQLEVDSPVSGYITERNALPNLTVQPETHLYSVADLSTVWVLAEVFQIDLGRIKVGDRATLIVDSYPGRESGAKTHSRDVRQRRAESADGKAVGHSRKRRAAIWHSPDSFRQPRRRLHRAARSATRRTRWRRYHRAERSKGERRNRYVRQFPDRLREPASGRTRFVRSTSTRRGCGVCYKRSAGNRRIKFKSEPAT